MGKIKRIPNDEIPFINYLKNNLTLIFVFFETSTFLNYMRGSNSSFFQYFFYFYLRKLSFQIANMFIRLFLPEFRLVFRPVVLYLNIYTIHLIIIDRIDILTMILLMNIYNGSKPDRNYLTHNIQLKDL